MVGLIAAVLGSGLILAQATATETVVYTMKDGDERRISMPLEDCVQIVYAMNRKDIVFPDGMASIGCYYADGQEWTGNLSWGILMGGTDLDEVAYYEALLDAGMLPPGATVSPPHFPVITGPGGRKFILKIDGHSCKYVEGKLDYETNCESADEE